MRIFSKPYATIDKVPVYNWYKFQENYDYTLLLNRWFFKKIDYSPYWNALLEEYISVFGMNPRFLEIIELRKEIVLLEIKCILNNDLWAMNFVNIKKKMLEQMEKDGDTEQDFYKIVNSVERKLNITIDEHSMTIRKFQTLYIEASHR